MNRCIPCAIIAIAVVLLSIIPTGRLPLPSGGYVPPGRATTPLGSRQIVPATTAAETRVVFSPSQATVLAQAWVARKSVQIPQWRKATVGTPMVYFDLNGWRTAYVFSVFEGVQDVGYVILSYETRVQPVLEFSTNPAPHLRCGDRCKAVAADQELSLATDRPIFLGPLDYFFEALPDTPDSKRTRRWLLHMNGGQLLEVENQFQHPQPQEAVATTVAAIDDIAIDSDSAHVIYGLPDYNQFYGPSLGYDFVCYSGCTPTAATNMAHFWGAAGYANFLDAFWPDTTVDLRTHMETFCYGDTGSTWTHKTAPGLVSFAQARNYSFESLQYCWPTDLNWAGCEHREFTWQRYTDEIDQCRPPLISISNHPTYGSHSVTGVGYDTDGGNYYVVHDNWVYTPSEVWILHEDVENRYRFLFPFIPPHVDGTPPARAVVNALPPYQASTRFDVSWSSTDAYPGIGSYDAQYRDGSNGDWQWWLRGTSATSARLNDAVSLEGGHTYYVRVRARDKHCNTSDWSEAAWSVADANPPTTAVHSQPRYRTETSFPVSWGGYDDAAGIAFYDIWSKPDGGEWLQWQSNVTTTSAIFSDTQVGGTTCFASIGTDRLGRQEVKGLEECDTLVTVARHSISGRVLGNRGKPAFLAQINATTAYTATRAGAQGEYALFFPHSEAVTITVRSPSGQSTLPPMKGITLTAGISQLIGLDLVLPPPDNLVQNSHFEDSNPAASWVLGGDTTPLLTQQAHTGNYALALGALPGTTQATTSVKSPKTHRQIDDTSWSVSQTITLPTTIEKPTLSWFYTVSGTPHISDTLTVAVLGLDDPIAYTAPLTVTGWQHVWLGFDETTSPRQVIIAFVLHRSQTPDPLLVLLDEITCGSGDDGPASVYLPLIIR